jgi:NADH-quinone oxidoreductase subunit H
MDLGWKALIPLALFWLLLVAALRVGRDAGWKTIYVFVAAVAIAAVVGTALNAALRLGDRASRSADDAREAML